MTRREIIARADAQAWDAETDEYISITSIKYEIKNELGAYPVVFSTAAGTSVERMIHVIDQMYVINEKANEAVSAFNFYKTPEEIEESVALDTDLKTWASAQGWKLSNEDESVEIYVEYDFDPENIMTGTYKVSFMTAGREFRINTTDYVEEGAEVGLTFYPEDIHVMRKMVY